MARQRNHVIRSSDQEDLKRLKEEYESLGRDTKLTQGELIVLALPRKYKRKR